jgi:hypothetical protein
MGEDCGAVDGLKGPVPLAIGGRGFGIGGFPPKLEISVSLSGLQMSDSRNSTKGKF